MTSHIRHVVKGDPDFDIEDYPLAANHREACKSAAGGRECARPRGHSGVHMSYEGYWAEPKKAWVTAYWVLS